jgi:AcrR family transcriptional regulator
MTTRKLLPREDRRASILRAAATAFARSGFADTSMSDVAVEAGVTRVLVYRHFDSKEDLYRAVLTRVVDLLDQTWVTLESAPSRDAVMRSHLSAARANPDGYRLLWHHADTEPEFVDYTHEVRSFLIQIADERVGDAIKPELRAWAMATLVTSIVEATLSWLDHGDPTIDEQFIAAASAGMVKLVEGWSTSHVGVKSSPHEYTAD